MQQHTAAPLPPPCGQPFGTAPLDEGALIPSAENVPPLLNVLRISLSSERMLEIQNIEKSLCLSSGRVDEQMEVLHAVMELCRVAVPCPPAPPGRVGGSHLLMPSEGDLSSMGIYILFELLK